MARRRRVDKQLKEQRERKYRLRGGRGHRGSFPMPTATSRTWLARELRDRYLEQVHADPGMLLPEGKYDVSRQLIHRRDAEPGAAERIQLLDAA